MSSSTNRYFSISDMTRIALAVSLLAISAWIVVPVTAVSFTMQTFAVFVIVGILGTKRGLCVVVLYILIGLMGLPVFSGFSGGIGVLMGNTGGYIIGFIFSVLVTGLIIHRFGKSTFILFLSMFLGLLVCYAFGSAWFYFLYTQNTGKIGIATVVSWCVFPFIPFDIIKISLAVFVTKRLSRYIRGEIAK